MYEMRYILNLFICFAFFSHSFAAMFIFSPFNFPSKTNCFEFNSTLLHIHALRLFHLIFKWNTYLNSNSLKLWWRKKELRWRRLEIFWSYIETNNFFLTQIFFKEYHFYRLPDIISFSESHSSSSLCLVVWLMRIVYSRKKTENYEWMMNWVDNYQMIIWYVLRGSTRARSHLLFTTRRLNA